jgi:hypothetical protein
MLLVETEPVSLAMLSSAMQEELAFSLETDLGIMFAFDLDWFLGSEPILVDDESGSKELLESFTPERRNLLCFCVCSFAPWIGRSHSLHRIALSSWQNRYPRLSCTKAHDIIN